MEKKNLNSAPKKEEQKKMSYEELNATAHQLAAQNEQLRGKLKEIAQAYNNLQMNNAFARLEFLFKVLKHKDVFKHDFVTACIEEIESTITLPEKPEEEVNDEKPAE